MTSSPRIATIRRALSGAPRHVLLAGVAAALALGAAGCGDDVPEGAIAKVDDTVIKKSEFDRAFAAVFKGQQQGSPGAVVLPDPPDFKKCSAARLKQPVPQGQKKPTASELRKECKQRYEAVRDQAVEILVSTEWVRQEAQRQGVKTTDAAVRTRFEELKKQSFPKDKDYKAFLKSSGMTEADLLTRVRLDILTDAIRKKVTAKKGDASAAQISQYYNKNKQRFAQPESRDVALVLTKRRSGAEKAHAALEAGQSFREVATRYSIDEASKAQGGKQAGIGKGQQEKAFDEAIFRAKKGELVGPIKTQFGYYVFKVTKITSGSQQTLAESKTAIKGILKSEGEQKALSDFIKSFRERYKEKTICATGFITQSCKNAPKKGDKGAASGGSPAGPGSQPGAPGGAGGVGGPGGAPSQAPQPGPG